MSIDLSILLLLHDLGPAVTTMVRDARELGSVLAGEAGFEILALDERSGDNTLSFLSILHAQVPELRTLQDLGRNLGISQGARVARGRHWLLIDRPVSTELLRWALLQVRDQGHPAAIVPASVLALTASTGIAALYDLRGGLVSAQRAVERNLRKTGSQRAAWHPAPEHGVARRALHYLQRQLIRGRLGDRRSGSGKP
ncbi:MAG TPA: hypothetical protein ENJ18_13035 [Nannocystis exedens]|nr:hypothetical protein [Nannocystis exedens]